MAVATRPRARSRPATPVVATATVASAIVAFRHLGTKPLWLDEAVSVSVAGRSLPRLLAVIPHQDANAAVYYLLLHGWLVLGRWLGVDHGAGWVRVPSASALVATAALAAWVGCRWRGAWLGTAAGALVASNRFLVFYGQEARPYALAVLLAVASTAALLWDDGEPAIGAYIAATVALLYVDLFALLFVAAVAACVAADHLRRQRRTPLPLVRAWITIGLAALPLAVLMLAGERNQISWLPRPGFGYLRLTLAEMGNGWIGVALLTGLAAAAWAWRSPGDPRRWAALAAGFVAPPVLLWSGAQLVPMFVDRYVICSAVGLLGMGALGVDAVRRRFGAAVAAAALLLPVGVGVDHTAALERAPYKYEDPPAVVAFIAAREARGDVVGFGSGGLRTVVDDYVGPGTRFPADIAVAPGGAAVRQDGAYAREVDAGTLGGRLAGVNRLWLVTDPTDHRFPTAGPFAPVRPVIEAQFSMAAALSSPGIDVTLYVRRAPPPDPPRATGTRAAG